MLCSPAWQLVTSISFEELILLAVNSTVCANAALCVQTPHCVCVQGGVYVCCRSLVLYSLCHTEYWLGGRWLNGSCLALLMSFLTFCVIFISSHLFDLLAVRIQVLVFALLQTSNPLTSADNVSCLPHWGHLLRRQQHRHRFPSECARGACFRNVAASAGCAWEPQCVMLTTKDSANASPAQSELSLSSSSVSQNTLIDDLLSPLIFISSSTTGLDFSALFSLEGYLLASPLLPLLSHSA